MVDHSEMITCPLCATSFDSDERAACSACPIGRGCHLVCCPNCGSTMVDHRESRLAGWMTRRLHKGQRRHRPDEPAQRKPLVDWHSSVPLADAPLNAELVVKEMQALPRQRQRHLRSYGLTPGSRIRAVRHSPLTVILVDHTEIGLENVLAQGILVQVTEERS
ncbi:MAG: FeoA family protein [Anaerolineales bacterium]